MSTPETIETITIDGTTYDLSKIPAVVTHYVQLLQALTDKQNELESALYHNRLTYDALSAQVIAVVNDYSATTANLSDGHEHEDAGAAPPQTD